MAKYFKIGPYGLVASVLIAWSIVFRASLLAVQYPETNSDEGAMGIEAMHIAFQGQHPLYLYGQNYMGVLEAYLAAPFFHFFTISVFTLRLGLLILFALFLVAMYWLGSLLYSKRLALVSLALLSLATGDMLIQQLRAVGGAVETLLFGSLMLVLAYRLASTTGQRRRWRYLTYAVWGLTASIALWVHMLALPFVLCSGLLILVFCRREWRSPALPCLLLGLLVGGIPLLYGYEAFAAALVIHSGSTASANPLQQILSTLLWGIPLATGVQPVCAITDLPTYGPTNALTVPCVLLQGAWSAGYLVLLGAGLLAAAAACWQLWWQQRGQPWAQSSEKQRRAVLHFARLMHLLPAALTILLYASSPLSALKPWSTRYLVGLLVATPGILWPLWQLTALEKFHLSHKPVSKWLSRAAIVLIMLIWLVGTVYTITTVPAANADARQQEKLVQDLLKLNIRHVYVEYWTCYRLLFQSQEQILCARPPYPPVIGADRYEPDARLVEADRRAAYMFLADSTREIMLFEQHIKARGEQFQKYTLDGMVVYVPRTTG